MKSLLCKRLAALGTLAVFFGMALTVPALAFGQTDRRLVDKINSLAKLSTVKKALTLFSGTFETKSHPAGWDYMESTNCPGFDKVRVTLANDPKRFTDIMLELTPDTFHITKGDVLANYGRNFRIVPAPPDNFDTDTLSFAKKRRTNLIFSLTVTDSEEVLSSVIIRKL